MALADESKALASQFVDGFQIPAIFPVDSFRSAVSYKPRPDDLFIVTYPKCGTTWTQHIVMLILNHGENKFTPMNFHSIAPFLEISGSEMAESMPRPGAIKTHLPFHLAPWSPTAKYIYVTRNPKDCCVSYYHHMKAMPGHFFTASFDDFFELFITGKTDYGDYFDHLLGFYEHRNDPNVLFVTYEEMKEDHEAAILKMASFIDEELYAKPLREDPQKLSNVLKYSSFKHMKEFVNKSMDEMFSMSTEDILNSEIPDQLKKLIVEMEKLKASGLHKSGPPNPSNFVRKGIVGDWRNHFSEDQSKRLDEKFTERTKGTDIAEFWKIYM